MNNCIADSRVPSRSCRISHQTARVNTPGKRGTRPSRGRALPGRTTSKFNCTKKKRKHPVFDIFSQNCRGLKTDGAVTELIDSLRCRKGFAMALQETWREGKENFSEDGFVFLGSGPRKQVGRGSCGVGILLSPTAVVAWQAANSVLHNDLGDRVIATRLIVEDESRQQLGIHLIAAYAPTTNKNDPGKDETAKADYESSLARAISLRKPGDVLLICADANASIGRGSLDGSGEHTVVGPYGINHLNDAGRRLRSFLSVNNLVSLSSFFKKKYYGTWQHPASRLQHQLDHFFILQSDLKRFTDAGGCCGQLIDSDHRAVKCSLRAAIRLQKKPQKIRDKLTRLDMEALRDKDVAEKFSRKVVSSLSCHSPGRSPVSYSDIATALNTAAVQTLPKRKRGAPQWFEASAGTLRKSITNRNSAFNAWHRTPTPENKVSYKSSRSEAQRFVRQAKSEWIVNKCRIVNSGFDNARGGKGAWDMVKVLRSGLCPPRRPPPAKMKRPDGTIASTPEENGSVFADHFSGLYGRQPSFDESVLDLLPQEPVYTNLDLPPSDDEILKASRKLRDTSPGASGLHARLWRALMETPEGFAYVREFVISFWLTEHVPSEWETGLLKILPKKGDLSDPGNYRGIMMLEVAYKIVAYILLTRLKPIKEGGQLDHEPQCGFMAGRGRFDGIFTLRQMIKKRHEHGLGTWLLLIDLVKAFDRVPRELLWQVMGRQGVPPRLISLLQALHKTVHVKFEVDGVEQVIDSIIGVKQGDLLGPELFTFFMAAVMKTWRSSHPCDLCTFKYRQDFELTGRRHTASGEEFSLSDSEYADDTGFVFTSREDTQRMTPLVVKHFARWGMQVHVGKDDKGSKSEILFCAADSRTHTGFVDLSPITWGDGYHMPVVEHFKYLGSYLSRDCTDNHDVDSRIESAGKAFGALRKCLFSSSTVSFAAKRAVYTTVVLTILLSGCECWSLTEKLIKRLEVFHHQCVRAMCRVTRKHTWERHIKMAKLLGDLDLQPIRFYVFKSQLGWFGHVCRMGFERIPRRLLSCWVQNPRPSGAPKFTYGRTVKKALAAFGIKLKNTEEWQPLVVNRAAWKAAISSEKFLGRCCSSKNRPQPQPPLPAVPPRSPTPPQVEIEVEFQGLANPGELGTCTIRAKAFVVPTNLSNSFSRVDLLNLG